MSRLTHQVDHYEIGLAGNRQEIGGVNRYEIGLEGDRMEIGLEGDRMEIGAIAVQKVIQAARDNRAPAPPMKAVAGDELEDALSDAAASWICETAVEVGCAIGAANPFPKTTALLQKYGAGGSTFLVRVDSTDSYHQFRASQSPEMAEFQDRLAALEERFAAHVQDPDAHSAAEVEEHFEEVAAVGAEVELKEAAKEIEMWLPSWAKGKVRAWRDGDFVCASVDLPGKGGQVRVCTSMIPVVQCIEEMEHHAATANVPAAAVVGVIDEMGCVLGAGTIVKHLAAAAPAILAEESKCRVPFVCRIEPKQSPALCAFVDLAHQCAAGDQQACAEWNALADAADKGGAAPVAQMMREAKAICRK